MQPVYPTSTIATSCFERIKAVASKQTSKTYMGNVIPDLPTKNVNTVIRIASALELDYQVLPGKRFTQQTEVEMLLDAINTTLVILGGRSAARLDNTSYCRNIGRCVHWDKSMLLRAVHVESRRLGRRIDVVAGKEPIVVDASVVIDADVKTLHELYNTPVSDMKPPLIGAMQRVLGYQCKYPASKGGGVSLEVHLYDNRGRSYFGQLGGFYCPKKVPRARMVEMWIAPCSAKLAGSSVDFMGRRYTVAGFRLSNNNFIPQQI